MTRIESIVKKVNANERQLHYSDNNADRYQKITDTHMEEYKSMPLPKLLELILKKDNDSQRALYYLLTISIRDELHQAFQKVFFTDGQFSNSFKTFEDYLSDFFIFLFLHHPKSQPDDTRFYHLTTIGDPLKLKSWMFRTFRNFLQDEQEILSKLQEALKQYQQQLVAAGSGEDLGLTMMHIAFALAQFNQNETELDRYIFFRKIYREYAGPNRWKEELEDREVADILGMQYNAYRTRSSRLATKVKNEIRNITDAKIATLDKSALDLAKRIYNVSETNLEDILKSLLDTAEKELLQYAEIHRRKLQKASTLARQVVKEDDYTLNQIVKIPRSESSIISIFEKIIGWGK